MSKRIKTSLTEGNAPRIDFERIVAAMSGDNVCQRCLATSRRAGEKDDLYSQGHTRHKKKLRVRFAKT